MTQGQLAVAVSTATAQRSTPDTHQCRNAGSAPRATPTGAGTRRETCPPASHRPARASSGIDHADRDDSARDLNQQAVLGGCPITQPRDRCGTAQSQRRHDHARGLVHLRRLEQPGPIDPLDLHRILIHHNHLQLRPAGEVPDELATGVRGGKPHANRACTGYSTRGCHRFSAGPENTVQHTVPRSTIPSMTEGRDIHRRWPAPLLKTMIRTAPRRGIAGCCVFASDRIRAGRSVPLPHRPGLRLGQRMRNRVRHPSGPGRARVEHRRARPTEPARRPARLGAAAATAAPDAAVRCCSARRTRRARGAGDRSPKVSIRSVTSVRTVNTRHSAKQFARGHRGGILTTSIPAVANTASNATVNCPARSRTRNRNRPT